jgi:hypothetical protein
VLGDCVEVLAEGLPGALLAELHAEGLVELGLVGVVGEGVLEQQALRLFMMKGLGDLLLIHFFSYKNWNKKKKLAQVCVDKKKIAEP